MKMKDPTIVFGTSKKITPKKFSKGRQVDSISEYAELIERGEWTMLRGIPKSPEFVKNMTLRTLMAFVTSGSVHRAVRSND